MWKGTGGCIMMVHSNAPYILQWVHCCDCWFDEWEWSERYKWLDKSVIYNSQIGIRYASHTKDEAKNNWGSSLWKQQMKKEAIALKNVPNYLISKKITCKICTLCIRMNLSHFSTVISFVLSCSSHNSLEDSSFRFKLLNFQCASNVELFDFQAANCATDVNGHRLHSCSTCMTNWSISD